MADKELQFNYKITLSNGELKEFDLKLDPDTLSLRPNLKTPYPEWTRLTYYQCANCPLNEKESPQCPVAANLTDVIDFVKRKLSYTEVDVEIQTNQRTYKKHAALQGVLSSLIGIIMTTSGCPILDKLRPLVRTHLPFSNLEETTYRVLSMYLLSQYFLMKKGKAPDWEFKHLVEVYEAVQTVNKHFHKRIASLGIEDAALNAIANLDCYAQFTNMLLTEERLGKIEKLFKAYLEKN